MDPNQRIQETPESKSSSSEEQNQQLPILPAQSISPPFATASISLCISTILPTHFLTHPKVDGFLSQTRSNVKIPIQAACLSRLSLSPSSPYPHKSSFKSTISANPLQTPLYLGPRRSSDPSNAAGLRRACIVWFRNDLRVNDNQCLNSANDESMSVLPVFCFDPKKYGKSSSGFNKTGPCRATFVIESVSDLRKALQARGSDLVVSIGKPETVLVELAKAIGADAVYAHREVSHDDVQAEEKIEAAMKDEGIEVKYFWGSTLYHVDDLPFSLEDMPSNCGGFREKVQGLEIRETIAALDQLKGLPSRGDVEPGEIPSLLDLGLNPSQDGKPAGNASIVGGETEALQKIKKFAAECQAQPPKGINGNHNNIYGANFSCKISPWLTMGCISPRTVFDELKKTRARTISTATNSNDSDGGSSSSNTGTNWLMFELSWRDFFRFITKKYSSSNKQLELAPATACAGALA